MFTFFKLTLLYFSLYLSSFIILSHSIELCNPQDKIALLKFKQSFGQPTPFSSWQSDADCCDTWKGVRCDEDTNRVNSLYVVESNISGNIPNVVGDLTFLTRLAFYKVPNLIGPIPYTITKLQNLTSLQLSSTGLSGSIPSFLSQLKNLNSLDLSSNKFSGSIPSSLSQLTNLAGLSLTSNKLTGSIPNSFGSFKQNDFDISLSNNKLSGSIPTTLGRVNFRSLYFDHNQLSGDISFLFGDNKVLEAIDLSYNRLEFDISKVVFGYRLIILYLQDNRIYGSFPPSFSDLPQLQYMNVSYNQLCGPIPTDDHLSKFDQSSYFHNKCLCGSPLPPCH